MRYFTILVFICGWGITVQAQQKVLRQPYQIQTRKATIAWFLNDINRQSGVVLEYSLRNFDAEKEVVLSGQESTLGSVLEKILEGQFVKLEVHNNKILLIPATKPFIIENPTQERFSFYGYVKENSTLEPLINATIFEPSTRRGVVTNHQGYFNFLLSKGNHILEISYGGLQPQIIELTLNGNTQRDVSLRAGNDTLPTVVIESTPFLRDGSLKKSENQSSYGFMNEDDPLQYLYLSPGLQHASYSFNGFQVRGGGTDENLFLLDGNPVYNPTHLLGAISILNPTVIKAMHFYKSDFPARIEGSLSSVLDVYTKQGNMKNWQGEANIGLLAGSLTLEGPIIKDKIALMISGRKNIPFTFYQHLQDGIKSDFYDAHIRVSALLSQKSKLALTFYKGEDRLRYSGKYIDNLTRWGNSIGSVSWNYLLGARSFIQTSVNFSHYENLGSYQYSLFESDEDEDGDEDDDVVEENDDLSIDQKYIGTLSTIKNYNLKSQAEIYISEKLKLNGGIKLSQTIIKPFDSKITDIMDEDEENFLSFTPLPFEELSLYTEAEIKLTRKLFIKPGGHVNLYRFHPYRSIALQPRLYISYRTHPMHKFYASYSRMNQFLHLVTNPYAGNNRDLWVPSTEQLRPEQSDIFNIGYTFRHGNQWKLFIDGYYKLLNNVTNYAEGKSTFINSINWEQNIELGKGNSYGAEWSLHFSNRKFSWQAGYALSWSWRQFKSINNGRAFPYKYDHRHAVNLGVLFSVSPRLDITGSFSFVTGNVYAGEGLVFADTLMQAPSDDPVDDFGFIYHYVEQNQYRSRGFRRFDLAITYHILKNKKWNSSLKAGVYDINGAEGQYTYNVRGSLSSKSIRIKTGASVFNLIPYLSYSLRF